MSEWRRLAEEYPCDELHFWVCGGDYERPVLMTNDDFTYSIYTATHWAPCDPPAWPPTTGQEGE